MRKTAAEEKAEAEATGAVAPPPAAAAPPPAAAAPPPAAMAAQASAPASEVDRILDIPLKISVELGRTKMLINDLLQLGQGSVIELTKLVGEPLDVMVNEKLGGER